MSYFNWSNSNETLVEITFGTQKYSTRQKQLSHEDPAEAELEVVNIQYMIKREDAPSQSFEDCELPPFSETGAGCRPKYFVTASDAAIECLLRYAWLLISMSSSLVQM